MLLGNKQKQNKKIFFLLFRVIDHALILFHKHIIKNHVSDSKGYKKKSHWNDAVLSSKYSSNSSSDLWLKLGTARLAVYQWDL